MNYTKIMEIIDQPISSFELRGGVGWVCYSVPRAQGVI